MVVGIADMAVTSDQAVEMVTHSLGAGLAVSAYDPELHQGGMLRILMPHPPTGRSADDRPCTFADTGLPALLDELEKADISRDRLEIKLVGAAQFLKSLGGFNTGQQNVEAIEEAIAANGLKVSARAVGGAASVNARFRLADGLVTVTAPGTESIQL